MDEQKVKEKLIDLHIVREMSKYKLVTIPGGEEYLKDFIKYDLNQKYHIDLDDNLNVQLMDKVDTFRHAYQNNTKVELGNEVPVYLYPYLKKS